MKVLQIKISRFELKAIITALNNILVSSPGRLGTIDKAVIHEACLLFFHRVQRINLLMEQKNKTEGTLKLTFLETKVMLSIQNMLEDVIDARYPLRLYADIDKQLKSTL